MTNKNELTLEQKDELVAFFQNNDFTANMALEREHNSEGEQAKIYVVQRRFSVNIGLAISVKSESNGR